MITNKPITPDEFDDALIEFMTVRGLFCSVLHEHWKLSFDGRKNDTYLDIWQARRWFGTEGYHEVCYLAGVCGHAVFRAFRIKAANTVWGKDYV